MYKVQFLKMLSYKPLCIYMVNIYSYTHLAFMVKLILCTMMSGGNLLSIKSTETDI